MTARPKTAVVGMKIRMREPLRARLEAAARKKGISLAKELTSRVESTFIKDEALGGVDARQIALLMGAAFTLAASRKGQEMGVKDWANDGDCYVAGLYSVLGELLKHKPRPLTRAEYLGADSVLKTDYANQGGNKDAR
jgi:hypothetical protein